MDYFDKYLKYKKKYINLKNNKIKLNKKFYITHKTRCSSILSIINDGFIKAGIDLPKKFIVDNWNIDHIFANIIFDDFIPQRYLGLCTLILNPQIIQDFNIGVYKTWSDADRDLIEKFKKNDSQENINKKLDSIFNFFKKDKFIKENQDTLLNHQLVISEPIDIKKYLYGIHFTSTCEDNDIKNQKKIIKALKKHNMTHVKIFYPKSKEECFDYTPYTYDEIFNEK